MSELFGGIRQQILARRNLNEGTTELFKTPAGGLVMLTSVKIHHTPDIPELLKIVRDREVMAGLDAFFYETIFSPSYLDSLHWITCPQDSDLHEFLSEFCCVPTHATMISSCPKAWQSNDFLLTVRLEAVSGS